jgi:hypothetical protein
MEGGNFSSSGGRAPPLPPPIPPHHHHLGLLGPSPPHAAPSFARPFFSSFPTNADPTTRSDDGGSRDGSRSSGSGEGSSLDRPPFSPAEGVRAPFLRRGAGQRSDDRADAAPSPPPPPQQQQQAYNNNNNNNNNAEAIMERRHSHRRGAVSQQDAPRNAAHHSVADARQDDKFVNGGGGGLTHEAHEAQGSQERFLSRTEAYRQAFLAELRESEGELVRARTRHASALRLYALVDNLQRHDLDHPVSVASLDRRRDRRDANQQGPQSQLINGQKQQHRRTSGGRASTAAAAAATSGQQRQHEQQQIDKAAMLKRPSQENLLAASSSPPPPSCPSPLPLGGTEDQSSSSAAADDKQRSPPPKLPTAQSAMSMFSVGAGSEWTDWDEEPTEEDEVLRGILAKAMEFQEHHESKRKPASQASKRRIPLSIYSCVHPSISSSLHPLIRLLEMLFLFFSFVSLILVLLFFFFLFPSLSSLSLSLSLSLPPCCRAEPRHGGPQDRVVPKTARGAGGRARRDLLRDLLRPHPRVRLRQALLRPLQAHHLRPRHRRRHVRQLLVLLVPHECACAHPSIGIIME